MPALPNVAAPTRDRPARWPSSGRRGGPGRTARRGVTAGLRRRRLPGPALPGRPELARHPAVRAADHRRCCATWRAAGRSRPAAWPGRQQRHASLGHGARLLPAAVRRRPSKARARRSTSATTPAPSRSRSTARCWRAPGGTWPATRSPSSGRRPRRRWAPGTRASTTTTPPGSPRCRAPPAPCPELLRPGSWTRPPSSRCWPCAPQVHADTAHALVAVESGFNP